MKIKMSKKMSETTFVTVLAILMFLAGICVVIALSGIKGGWLDAFR